MRLKTRDACTLMSLERLAQHFGKKPKQITYLCHKYHIPAVAAIPGTGMDKRRTYYALETLSALFGQGHSFKAAS